MAKNTNFVSHKKSKQKNQDGTPQLPLASALVEGEIAINFAENVETLSIKNESGDVVTFSSDNYYTEKKLGSAFTGANSAVTVTDVIEENEEIVATALNDLNENKLDASAYTPTDLSDYYTKEEVDIRDLWVSGTGLNAVVIKGGNNIAVGDYSVAEGQSTSATSYQAHAEGYGTLASGEYSHAEGYGTLASGHYSHAESDGTKAIGDQSHAEGYNTIARGVSSHAEGHGTTGSGEHSHAEGYGTLASGNYSHAEGYFTIASSNSSHAEGCGTITNNLAEHASGQYNVSNSASTTFGDSGNTLFSVGNGTGNARHNAFEIRQNGDIYIVNKDGNDVKLQDEIGNITIDQVIDSGTSASTNAVSTSAVYGFVTSYTPSITVDQVLDNTTSASTNPVSSKAVYDAVTDNELVWTNAYVTLSGTVSAHTADTTIHSISVVSAVTVSADLTNVTCPTSITGSSKSGAQAVVIYENSGSTADYTISVSTTYKTPDGNQIQMTCPKNGYCEVNYLNINGTIYARGI